MHIAVLLSVLLAGLGARETGSEGGGRRGGGRRPATLCRPVHEQVRVLTVFRARVLSMRWCEVLSCVVVSGFKSADRYDTAAVADTTSGIAHPLSGKAAAAAAA